MGSYCFLGPGLDGGAAIQAQVVCSPVAKDLRATKGLRMGKAAPLVSLAPGHALRSSYRMSCALAKESRMLASVSTYECASIPASSPLSRAFQVLGRRSPIPRAHSDLAAARALWNASPLILLPLTGEGLSPLSGRLGMRFLSPLKNNASAHSLLPGSGESVSPLSGRAKMQPVGSFSQAQHLASWAHTWRGHSGGGLTVGYSATVRADVGAGALNRSGGQESKGRASEDGSLDDLCPSLDTEPWDLVQERPPAPRPPQEQLWSDPPTRPKPAPPLGSDAFSASEGDGKQLAESTAVEERQPYRSFEEDADLGFALPLGRRGQRGQPRSSSPNLPSDWVPEREFRRGLMRGGRDSAMAQEQGFGSRYGIRQSEGFNARSERNRLRSTLVKFLHERYEIGEELTEDDASFVISQILSFHPRASEKMGEQVLGIKVDVHPEYRDTKCFFVKAKGIGWVDFSYLKCLENRFQMPGRQGRGGYGASRGQGNGFQRERSSKAWGRQGFPEQSELGSSWQERRPGTPPGEYAPQPRWSDRGVDRQWSDRASGRPSDGGRERPWSDGGRVRPWSDGGRDRPWSDGGRDRPW